MISALLFIFNTVINIYIFVLFATVILSWLIAFDVVNTRHPLMRQIQYTLGALTEPVLQPIRKILPAPGGLDFSPFVLILVLTAVQIGVNNIIRTGSLLS